MVMRSTVLFDQFGVMHALRRNGTSIRRWDTFRPFLADELTRAEEDYPRFESFMEEAQKKAAEGRRGGKDGFEARDPQIALTGPNAGSSRRLPKTPARLNRSFHREKPAVL
jgi:hypothetical protein